MALIKDRQLDNGLILSYHRIVTFNTLVNDQIIVEVHSYPSKATYIDNLKSMQANGINNMYIGTKWYATDYKDSVSISDLYTYLKTLGDFKDATDDWDTVYLDTIKELANVKQDDQS